MRTPGDRTEERIAILLTDERVYSGLNFPQFFMYAGMQPENEWLAIEYANAVENQGDGTCRLEDFEPRHQQGGVHFRIARQGQMGRIVQIAD